MREIVLDTETTGLDPHTGDRLVEIACVEIHNLLPTGRTFHSYIDPQRDVPEEAFRVHGLSSDFLRGKPLFEHICEEFLAFIGDARLIIHNAEFDMKFINHELRRAGRTIFPLERVFDTLAHARRKHPGASNSLDALCARYRIDNSKRTKHGALLDSEILAAVYVELMGGRQTTLVLASEERKKVVSKIQLIAEREAPLAPRIHTGDVGLHERLRAEIGAHALWNEYNAE